MPRVLFTGGTRSGKSLAAERRLGGEPAVTYVATALPRPGDAEWARRVALHQGRRPPGWTTVETLELVPLLQEPPGPLLVDSMSLWVAALLDAPDLDARVDALVQAWSDTPAPVVLVTDEVGSGVHAPTESGRHFADALGGLNARLADAADEAWLCVAGQQLRLR